ncbi:MAG: hypothetical protein SFH39_00945 [Candidatus Magnetobacterium sp. LHC-1]
MFLGNLFSSEISKTSVAPQPVSVSIPAVSEYPYLPINAPDIRISDCKYVAIYSDILNDTIVIISERQYLKEARADFPGVVVYSLREFRDICKLIKLGGFDVESLKMIHMAKKTLGGGIVEVKKTYEH